jgi:hypothetical protein
MLDYIKKETLKFLGSASPEVLVIKGRWGTGKTFTWNQWLTEAIKQKQISLKQYAYVSLFGCSSLDQLKAEIFEQTNSISGGQDFFKKIKEFEKFTNISKNLPFVRIDLNHLGWLSVQDTLICIDDIERHGEGLYPKDVFGLISVLKEQRNCKVVLILNDESIKDENKEVYDQYREKVIDIELHFNPETDDLVPLVFDKKYPLYEKISECVKALAEKNVRTLQKIRRYVDIINPELKDLPSRYKNSIINSIVLFTVLHFSKPEKWPTLDEVLEADTEKFVLVHWVDDEEKAKIHKVDLKWIQNLSILKTNYEWNGSDETDQVLGRFVKQGYLNANDLKAVLKKTVLDAKREEAKEAVQKLHHKVGKVLHESMNDNFDELVKVMNESIQKSTELYPSIAHLNQYVSILRGLEADGEANALIDYYIELAQKKIHISLI